MSCGLACRNACEATGHARRLKDADVTPDQGHQITLAKTYNPGLANPVLFRTGAGACSLNAVDAITAAVHAKEYPVDGLNRQRNGPTVLRACAKSRRTGGPDSSGFFSRLLTCPVVSGRINVGNRRSVGPRFLLPRRGIVPMFGDMNGQDALHLRAPQGRSPASFDAEFRRSLRDFPGRDLVERRDGTVRVLGASRETLRAAALGICRENEIDERAIDAADYGAGREAARAQRSDAGAIRASGEGPEFVKMGHAVRYTAAKLNEWLEARSRRSTSDDGSRQRCMRIDCPV